MKILSRLFLTLLIGSTSLTATRACAWDPAWDLDFYRFFEPEIVGPTGFQPFHFTFDLLSDYAWNGQAGRRSDNIKDWQRHFNNAYDYQAIEQVVYDSDILTLQSGKTGNALGQNALVKAFQRGEHSAEYEYLLLAKECEPYNKAATWNSERVPLTSANDDLVQALQQLYGQTASDWLKLRIAFQMVRLLHYGGYFQDAITAYTNYADGITGTGSPIEGWALSQYAGAIHGTGDHRTSSYLFSRVFDEYPSRRVQAWYSFDVRSDGDWQAVLDLCKNDSERANVYAMRAISPDAIAIEDMRRIQALEPGSEQLDLLLVREINKIEKEVLGNPWSSLYGGQDEGEEAEQANLEWVQSFQAFVQEVRGSGQMAQPNLWALADAYLNHLAGRSAQARAQLANLDVSGSAKTEARLLDLSIKISQVSRIDRSVENDITKDLVNLKKSLPAEQVEELERYRDEMFGKVYEKQGDIGKALLARRQAYEAQERLEIRLLDDLMAFDKKDKKTLYERELHQRLTNSFDYDDLMEMKGTALFRKNLLPEAIAVFEKVPEDHRESSRFWAIGPDPFTSNTRDIINCEPGCHTNEFTKLTLAKTLLNLQKKAVTDAAQSGKYYHLLGNAFFNLSYFGPAWKGWDYYRGYSWNGSDPGNVMDLGMAMEYYRKSLASANNSEIAALSALMYAKCVIVKNYGPVPEYVEGYDVLASQYRSTDVYRMALNECRYFSIYVNR